MKKKIGLVLLLIAVAAVGTVFARDLPMIPMTDDAQSPVTRNLNFTVSYPVKKPQSPQITILQCSTNDKVKDGFELSFKTSFDYPQKGTSKKGDILRFYISVFYDNGDEIDLTQIVTSADNGKTYTLKIAEAKDAAKIRGVGINVIAGEPPKGFSLWPFSKKNKKPMFPPLTL